MNRLLAYMFIILGIGLFFNSTAKETDNETTKYSDLTKCAKNNKKCSIDLSITYSKSGLSKKTEKEIKKQWGFSNLKIHSFTIDDLANNEGSCKIDKFRYCSWKQSGNLISLNFLKKKIVNDIDYVIDIEIIDENKIIGKLKYDQFDWILANENVRNAMVQGKIDNKNQVTDNKKKIEFVQSHSVLKGEAFGDTFLDVHTNNLRETHRERSCRNAEAKATEKAFAKVNINFKGQTIYLLNQTKNKIILNKISKKTAEASTLGRYHRQCFVKLQFAFPKDLITELSVDKNNTKNEKDLAKIKEEQRKIAEEKKKIEEEKRKIADAKKKQEEEKKQKKVDEELYIIGTGTGFFVSSNGYVVSNEHVVGGCREVATKIKGEVIKFKIITTDINNDIGLIKTDFNNANYLNINPSGADIGEDIVAFGYPLSDKLSSSVKLTRGIVSSLSGPGNNYSLIQIDAAIQPGNSGGPVLNYNSQVVGIASAGLRKVKMLVEEEYIPENVNFAVSASSLTNFLKANDVIIDSKENKVASTKELAKVGIPSTIQLYCLNTKAAHKENKKNNRYSDIMLEKVIDFR